jgi:metallo-beta-lactamase family protein
MPLLTFLGAERTVTGSKYLLEHDGRRVLVDCGLFQGLKVLRERNWQDLPIPASSIDAVVLTHAHLDHTGYLPRLVAQGFKGRAFCTPATQDLCRLVLPDAGRIQEEDARDANRQGYSKHAPALPLFSEADAFRALERLQPVGFDRPVSAVPGVEITYRPMGHLLGAAAIVMRLDGLTITFGGDLGRFDRPVLRDPEAIEETDFLLVESTYGDRVHDPNDNGQRLAEIVRDTITRGGKVIIPAFAIGRVEEVLYWLRVLEESGAIPKVPVFLDSPMAVEALRFYSSRVNELDEELRPEGKSAASFATSRFQTVASPLQSAELTASRTPAIVISSSGMATGGRVLHHLKRALPDSKNTVLFVGYQAPGTRGRSLVDGASEVKIHGAFVPANARVVLIDSMSAHADRTEILRWLGGFRRPPSHTFIVHGEPSAQAGLEAAIARELGPVWVTSAPDYLERVELTPNEVQ